MRESGISTRGCRDWVALRIRASMSAIGSVIVQFSVTSFLSGRSRAALPAALRHAGDVAFQRQLAEAQAAQRELAQIGARAAAALAAVAQPDLELRRLDFFGDLGGRGHL